jgi:hypothetical protein
MIDVTYFWNINRLYLIFYGEIFQMYLTTNGVI